MKKAEMIAIEREILNSIFEIGNKQGIEYALYDYSGRKSFEVRKKDGEAISPIYTSIKEMAIWVSGFRKGAIC